jgi:hypothetical protein
MDYIVCILQDKIVECYLQNLSLVRTVTCYKKLWNINNLMSKTFPLNRKEFRYVLFYDMPHHRIDKNPIDFTLTEIVVWGLKGHVS